MAVLAFFNRKRQELALEQFLAATERRAYQSALLTTRREADALDIVQDAMLQLVQHYREHGAEEWPKLFQRILQHKIVDWVRARHRQQGLYCQLDADENDSDPWERILDPRDINPAAILMAQQDVQRVLNALEILPLRQRQCFLLRAWEGFDTEATAQALGISSGSVKTHYARALTKLNTALTCPAPQEPSYAH
ncbi:MAG TPA: RNA polymerase sigma factor [Cellvibrionaceae bacterium]|nr:RNA polymerase sigma factor [Cellvibrionaceae bacterium]HNG60782.1 RNA polymerase sigma factor [Cellvibrionaceae bacterium]